MHLYKRSIKDKDLNFINHFCASTKGIPLSCSAYFAGLFEYSRVLHPGKGKQCRLCFRKEKRRPILIQEMNKRWLSLLINDLKAAVTHRRSLQSLLRAGEAVPQLPHSILLAGGKEGG